MLGVLEKAAGFLEAKGISRSRLDTEYMLAHVLGCKRLELYLQYDRPLAEDVLVPLRGFVRRRAKREPLQHILGTTQFLNVSLKTDARALIPRPETEELLERMRDKHHQNPSTVLDLGTGTGALAIAAAFLWPGAAVTAVDLDPGALELAKENLQSCEVTDRVKLVQSDWFTRVSGTYDLILANPPYLSEAEWEKAEPEVRDYDPRAALVANEDGIADLLKILCGARDYLNPGGMLAMETGIAHHEQLLLRARERGYENCISENDLAGLPRYIIASC